MTRRVVTSMGRRARRGDRAGLRHRRGEADPRQRRGEAEREEV